MRSERAMSKEAVPRARTWKQPLFDYPAAGIDPDEAKRTSCFRYGAQHRVRAVISCRADKFFKQNMDLQVALASEIIRRRPPPIAADHLPAGRVYIN